MHSRSTAASDTPLLMGLAIAFALAVIPLIGGVATPPAATTGNAVVDGGGYKTMVPPVVKRTAPLFPPSIDDFLVVTRRPDAVAVMADLNRPPLATGLLGRVFPTASRHALLLPTSGGVGTNVEALLQQNPDVVFASTSAAARYRQAGLTTLSIANTGDERYAIEAARLYGQGTGQFDRQPAMLLRYRDAMATLAAALGERRTDPTPSVLTLYDLQGRLFGLGTGTLQTELIAKAGGRNALAGKGPVGLDRERLLRLNPDVIVVMNTSPPSITPDTLMHDPVWAGLAAVRSRRIYRAIPALEFFPGGLVGTPLYARWLAELLHPALPAELRGQMRDAYLAATGYRMSGNDLDAALALDTNRAGAGYARFGR